MRLSICIPTHHGRAAVLHRALCSIAAQMTPELQHRVQVVISDNGSQDDTSDVVARHAACLAGALVQHRFEDNGGFTRNLLKVVDIADGDFCWLLGSDDEIEAHGIAAVLSVLDRHHDLAGMTVNRRNVDDLIPGRIGLDDPRVLPPVERAPLYTSAQSIFAELGMLQDYISTQVVNRQHWASAVDALGPKGLARGLLFPHLPILGHMVEAHPLWYWHADPLILHRIGIPAVDASVGRNLVEYLITVTDHRARIWTSMFGRRSTVYRAMMERAYLMQAQPDALAHSKSQPECSVTDDVRLLVTMTRRYGFLREFWLRSFPVLLVPHFLAFAIPMALRVNRRLHAQFSGA